MRSKLKYELDDEIPVGTILKVKNNELGITTRCLADKGLVWVRLLDCKEEMFFYKSVSEENINCSIHIKGPLGYLSEVYYNYDTCSFHYTKDINKAIKFSPRLGNIFLEIILIKDPTLIGKLKFEIQNIKS